MTRKKRAVVDDELNLEDEAAASSEEFLSVLTGGDVMTSEEAVKKIPARRKKKFARQSRANLGEKPKEELVAVKKKKDEFTIDKIDVCTPSDLWSLGATHFYKDGPLTLDEARDFLEGVSEFLAEMLEDLILADPRPTLKAIRYAQALVVQAGEDVGEYAWAELSAQEVTELIQKFGGKEEEKSKPKRASRAGGGRSTGGRSRKSSRKSSRSRSSGGSFKIKNPDDPATDPQLAKIEAECDRLDQAYPDGYVNFTKGEASDEIQALMAE